MSDYDQQVLQMLRLVMVPGLGPRRQRALLERFQNAEGIFQANRKNLCHVSGIGQKQAEAIQANRGMDPAIAEYKRCVRCGITPRLMSDPRYPDPLRPFPTAPLLLFTRGNWLDSDRRAIAIVGSRRCSTYGRRQAERMAEGLASAGFTVVSGLARGIDAAAHYATLRAEGRTIAVLASGLERIYPPEHRELAEEIAKTGLLISETPTTQTPSAGLFPQRNRLISALSEAVVVIEATRTSGTLHTVRHALEQGRDVFAIPGRVDSPTSEGCHDLIRDGAILATNPDDVLNELQTWNHGPAHQLATEAQVSNNPTISSVELSKQEQSLVEQIRTLDPADVDQILRKSDQTEQQVLSTITLLELKGILRRSPGGKIEFC